MKYTAQSSDEIAKLKNVPLQYRSVNWGPASSILLTIFFFLASQIIAAIMLVLVAIIFGGADIRNLQKDISVFDSTNYQFLGSLLVAVNLLVAIWLFLRYKKNTFKSLGLVKFKLKKFLSYGSLGVVIYLVVTVIAAAVLNIIWPEVLNQQQDIGFNRSASGSQLIPIFVSLVILPPLIEEILTRGFLFGGLRRHMNFVYAALITSILFSLAHLQGGDSQALIWSAVIDTFLLSIILCWLREKTGSLWASMLLHGIKNLMAFMAIFIFR